MRPRQQGGRVVAHNKRRKPVGRFLCQCWQCIDATSTDPVTGLPVQGQYLISSRYLIHKAQAENIGIASPQQSAAVVPIPPFLEPENPSNPEDHDDLGSFQDQEDVKAVLNRLRGFKTRLDWGLVAALEEGFKESPPLFIPVKSASNGGTGNLATYQVDDPSGMTAAMYQLDTSALQNSDVLALHTWLDDIHNYISENNLPKATDVYVRLRAEVVNRDVQRELDRFDRLMEEQWGKEKASLKACDKPDVINTKTHFSRPYLSLEPVALFAYIMVLIMYLLAGISMKLSNFTLASLRDMLSINPPENEEDLRGFDIPTDVRTVISHLNLYTPPTISYIACPKCYTLYTYNKFSEANKDAHPMIAKRSSAGGTESGASTFPETCNHRPTPGHRPCGVALAKRRRRGTEVWQAPKREFLYSDLKHWIGWMLCRPDIAQSLKRTLGPETSDGMKDIWDGNILRNFKYTDGRPFARHVEGEIRLVFSMNMDSFNPYGNRAAGKVVQAGGIYMALLNLPPKIRHRMENIYLAGIIPGPEAPKSHQINHILRPLVNDLGTLWSSGIFYTRTCNHPAGVRVRCALVPVVCDLPATSEIAGFGDHRSKHLCHDCYQTSDTIDESLDPHLLQPRDRKQHMEVARSWKDATDDCIRQNIYDKSHIRWSELFRLPYWDPTKFLTIDSMHCFYLGILHRHCRHIWGMDASIDDGDGLTFDRSRKNAVSQADMESAWNILHNGDDDQVKGLRVQVKSELCRELGLRYSLERTKERLQNDLFLWRKANRLPPSRTTTHIDDQPLPPHDTSHTSPAEATDKLDETYRTANKTTINRAKRDDLIALLGRRFRPLESFEAIKQIYKGKPVPQLRLELQAVRKEDKIINDSEKVINPIPPDHVPSDQAQTVPLPPLAAREFKKTRVLGHQTLAEVRTDMSRTVLPSWLTPGPRHPGETKWGKMKADEWKVFCTVHLPITLTRLWGGSRKDERQYRVLANFMHLVIAVNVASRRQVKAGHIDSYESHIQKYLTSLLELYPGANIVPNQHRALHFGEHLRRWGPCHAWRCFAFERFNGILQNTLTNSVVGQLEKTMFNKFRMAQSLRVLLLNAGNYLPSSLDGLVRQYEKFFKVDIRGTYLQDNTSADDDDDDENEEPLVAVPWKDGKYTSPSKEILKHLKHADLHLPADSSPCIIVQKEIRKFGQVFQAVSSSQGNSQIVFIDNSTSIKGVGMIKEIFAFIPDPTKDSDPELLLLVDQCQPLSKADEEFDHARSFGDWGARLYYKESRTTMIPANRIVCHFASVVQSVPGIPKECVLVLPLRHA